MMSIKPGKIAAILFWIGLSGLISGSTFICPNRAGAQGDAPEEVVVTYFYSYMNRDWEGCVQCLDPQFLITLKLQIINLINQAKHLTQRKMLAAYNVNSVDELRAIPSKEFYALYLKDLWEKQHPALAEDFDKARIRVLSTRSISAIDCLVQFYTSVNIGNGNFDRIQEYAVKKQSGKWKIYRTQPLQDSGVK